MWQGVKAEHEKEGKQKHIIFHVYPILTVVSTDLAYHLTAWSLEGTYSCNHVSLQRNMTCALSVRRDVSGL